MCCFQHPQIKKSYLRKDASNPLLKCQSEMEQNIFISVSSSKQSIEMIFMCRVKRPAISNILLLTLLTDECLNT